MIVKAAVLVERYDQQRVVPVIAVPQGIVDGGKVKFSRAVCLWDAAVSVEMLTLLGNQHIRKL